MSSKEAKMKMRYDLEGLRTEGMWTSMIHLYSIRGMVYGSSSEDVRIVTRKTRIRNLSPDPRLISGGTFQTVTCGTFIPL